MGIVRKNKRLFYKRDRGDYRYRPSSKTGPKPTPKRAGFRDRLARMVSRTVPIPVPSQRAACAAEALPHYEREARERLIVSTGGGKPRPLEKIPDVETGNARDFASRDFGVNPHYIQDAKRIRAERGQA